MSTAKCERLVRLLRLAPKARVLDMACGKGEFLLRLAEVYDVSGVGVDISPQGIKECVEKKRKRVPEADLEFIEMDGKDYEPEDGALFDVTMCIGASWIYGGYLGTLRALKQLTRPGGLMLVGEPYWIKDPPEEYLTGEGYRREDFGTHYRNVMVGEKEGLTCVYTLVSTPDDWDHYSGLSWWAVDDYVRSHPNDPDMPQIVEGITWKARYLRWGRDVLGWAIYVFRRP